MDFDWDTLDDFFVKRPWEQLLHVSPERAFAAFAGKGIFDEQLFDRIIEPLLLAKDLPVDATLLDLYTLTGKPVFLYSHDINTPDFALTAISHISHPSLKVARALHMTCAIPVAFQPVFYEGGCYIDGGVVANIPINRSIETIRLHIDTDVEFDTITVYRNGPREKTHIEEVDPDKSNFISYMNHIIFKLVRSVNRDQEQIVIPDTVWCDVTRVGRITDWITSIGTRTARDDLIRCGVGSVESVESVESVGSVGSVESVGPNNAATDRLGNFQYNIDITEK